MLYKIRLLNGLTLPEIYDCKEDADLSFSEMSDEGSYKLISIITFSFSELLPKVIGDMNEKIREWIGPNTFFDDVSPLLNELQDRLRITCDEWFDYNHLETAILVRQVDSELRHVERYIPSDN